MKLIELSSADLQRAIKLMQEKEQIQSRIAEIDEELNRIEMGKSGHSKGSAKASKQEEAGTRMKLKDAIIQELKNAGTAGLSLKELASKLGATSMQVSIWFGTTGKKIKEIIKLSRGQYGWADASDTAAANPSTPE